MKRLILFLCFIFVLSNVVAIDVSVKSLSENSVMVMGIDKPTLFEVQFTNDGSGDNFRFNNAVGFRMIPEDTIFVGAGETKIIQLQVFPKEYLRQRGLYKLEYNIFDSDWEKEVGELVFEIIDLEDAFEIGASDFNIDDSSLNVYVKNKKNFDFGEFNVKFSSAFFDLEKNLSLGPNAKQEFKVELNKEDFRKLMAGFYTLNAEIVADDEKANVEGIINFEEAESLKVNEKEYGFFVHTKIVEKKNEGNVVVDSSTVMKKNVFTRLWTSFSPEPTIVDREGFNVYYTWENKINPDEEVEIVVKTNWLFPLIVIMLVVLIVVFVKLYSQRDVSLRKQVSFVHAKGGEFALKVSVYVKARRYVEKITVVDRLPHLVKLYERFGVNPPRKVDEKGRKLEWGFESLAAGEKRVLSYIIYSKIGVLGKFELPPATAFYEKDGKIKEAESNRAFFVAEQM